MDSAQSEIQNLKTQLRRQQDSMYAQMEIMQAKIDKMITRQSDADYDNRLAVIKDSADLFRL